MLPRGKRQHRLSAAVCFQSSRITRFGLKPLPDAVLAVLTALHVYIYRRNMQSSSTELVNDDNFGNHEIND